MTPPLPASDRTRQLNVRLSPEDLEELRECSDALGITASDLVRYAVKKQLETINSKLDEHPERAALDGAEIGLALKTWDVARVTGRLPAKKKR